MTMKPISLLRILATVFIGVLLWSSPIARADPIQVAYGPVNTQPGNNGIGTLTTWAQSAIADFNANSYAGSPLPGLGAFSFQILPSGAANPNPSPAGWPANFTPGTTTSITLPLGGYSYVILSWGGSNIPGDNGTADYLYYIGNTSGNFTFTQPALANGGLSGVTVFGQTTPPRVPDGGATIALLGISLVGIGFLQRKLGLV